jgi:hypothetical protein
MPRSTAGYAVNRTAVQQHNTGQENVAARLLPTIPVMKTALPDLSFDP